MINDTATQRAGAGKGRDFFLHPQRQWVVKATLSTGGSQLYPMTHRKRSAMRRFHYLCQSALYSEGKLAGAKVEVFCDGQLIAASVTGQGQEAWKYRSVAGWFCATCRKPVRDQGFTLLRRKRYCHDCVTTIPGLVKQVLAK